eukprot:TRINITY_DN1683_c0_g1_i1.p1 TRINITY_DN1683_c0_g1~~TRINITY_DN1683_c0_g1_i1.p1  ORF type:complete len:748 (+),score=386.18 TRINITY_DN1683_c0_g1_i1:116-2245(+)
MAVSADTLRDFYFSAGTNYGAFEKKTMKQSAKGRVAAEAVSAPAVAAPAAPPAASAPSADVQVSPSQVSPSQVVVKEEPAPKKPAAGTGAALASSRKQPPPAAAPVAAHPEQPVATGVDTASQEYILFLKQQQELQKCHNSLEEILATFEAHRRTEQRDLSTVRRQAAEILGQMEAGSDWNLQSKYTVQNLIRDANLALQPQQLYTHDMEPQYLEIVQQSANLSQLKKDNQDKEQFEPYKVVVNNGLRRLDRVEQEVKESQLNASDLARTPDTLLIQLEHVFNAPTIRSLLAGHEETMEHLLFKLQEATQERESALDDGEMLLAEKHYYCIVELYEDLQQCVLDQLAIVDKTQKETAVFDKVRDAYQQKSQEDVKKIKSEKEQLKAKCEGDVKKLFDLRERIEDVEKATVAKMADKCREGDQRLRENTAHMEACWAQIEECERQLAALERERHREVKARIEDKERDEQRKMEFDRFCQVCDKHSSLLDLTIRNCDSLIHAATLLGEFVQFGFNALQKDFATKAKDYSQIQLHVHQKHLDMFRGLFLSLGELTHKKEKKIDDIDRQIQTTHINLELCADTLNPNAKKFSDAKKDLLRIRDDVELEVRELKQKAAEALEKFKISEEALRTAEIDYVHPVIEHQEQSLATRAKMVEYKAIANGHVDSVPIRNEIDDLKKQLATTKSQVETINSKASAMARTLPSIKDATASR